MSLMFVEIAGKTCCMHNAQDNKDFLLVLKKRYELLDEPGSMVNAASIIMLLDLVRQTFENPPKNDIEFNTVAFVAASQVCKRIENSMKLGATKEALRRTLLAAISLLEGKEDFFCRPGFDQLFVRIKDVVEYDGHIQSFDYYALFAEDFKQMEA